MERLTLNRKRDVYSTVTGAKTGVDTVSVFFKCGVAIKKFWVKHEVQSTSDGTRVGVLEM